MKLHTYLPKLDIGHLIEFQKLMLKPWNHIIMQPGNENAGKIGDFVVEKSPNLKVTNARQDASSIQSTIFNN